VDAPIRTQLITQPTTNPNPTPKPTNHTPQVRHRTGPLLQEVREGGLATPEGLSYLEAKQLVLSQYACCIVAYLLLKAEGRSVRSHPVISRCALLWGLVGGS